MAKNEKISFKEFKKLAKKYIQFYNDISKFDRKKYLRAMYSAYYSKAYYSSDNRLIVSNKAFFEDYARDILRGVIILKHNIRVTDESMKDFDKAHKEIQKEVTDVLQTLTKQIESMKEFPNRIGVELSKEDLAKHLGEDAKKGYVKGGFTTKHPESILVDASEKIIQPKINVSIKGDGSNIVTDEDFKTLVDFAKEWSTLNPSHYKKGGLEAWDVTHAFGLDHYKSTAVEYLLRAGDKLYPGKTKQESEHIDILKAIVWLKQKIKVEGGENE